jgi:hypothetical protein
MMKKMSIDIVRMALERVHRDNTGPDSPALSVRKLTDHGIISGRDNLEEPDLGNSYNLRARLANPAFVVLVV